MKLATSTGDFRDYTKSTIETLEHIHEAGFQYVDYNFGPDYGRKNDTYGENWQQYVAELKKKATSLGLEFVQAHSPMGRPLVDTEEMIRCTIRSIEVCGMLGIKNIVVHSGYVKDIDKYENFRRNKEFFLALMDTAEKWDVNILCENFDIMVFDDTYWIDNAPDLREFLDYVNHPRLHACWDIGHGNMQPLSQHEALMLLGKDVYALHVQDNLGAKDTHYIPYLGTVNFDSVMYGLKQINYQGYFTFETGVLGYWNQRREFDLDKRLVRPSLELKKKAERFLFELGEYMIRTSCDW